MTTHWFLAGVAAVAVSAAVRQLLDPLLGHEAPMLIFVLGVSLASALGGPAAGFWTTALSIPVGFYLFVEPRGSVMPHRNEDWVRLVVFIVEGALIAVVSGRVRQHAAELEEKVATRTAELRASNEALEAFAHTISHDLRAPLRSMRGFAEILEEDHAPTLPPGAREYTARIVAAAQRLERLINNLLAYARLGRREIPAESVALDRVVRAALDALQPELMAAQAVVTIDSPSLGVVRGHADTIQMMVTNLVTNAVKFVAPGVRPRVSLASQRVDGAVRLTVRDNGVGVPPTDRDRIFHAFERLHGRDEFQGTGLGLAIVARGAERMGGRYGVDSNGAGGSEFWIELPAAPREDHGPHPAR